jgi:hypothetical protein
MRSILSSLLVCVVLSRTQTPVLSGTLECRFAATVRADATVRAPNRDGDWERSETGNDLEV